MAELMGKRDTGKRRIKRQLIRTAMVLDRQPWAMILYMATVAAIMIACGMAYNSVIPAYQ